jgi:hypothetical protein
MDSTLSWRIIKNENGAEIKMIGAITVEANFKLLLDQIKDIHHFQLELSGITRLTSCGVREWMNFIRPLTDRAEVELRCCSPVIVAELNVFHNFKGNARIISIEAPFLCPSCDHEWMMLLEVTTNSIPKLEPVVCSTCGGKMEFDDLYDNYFSFIKDL